MKSVLLAILTIIAAGTGESRAAGDNSLTLTRSIVLKGISGRIDHMAIDVEGRRLFVAALGNNTIEVIDLAAGSRIGTIPGLKEPQGVVYIPEFNRIAVANGGDGSVRFYDGKSLQPTGSIDLKNDADNLRYDPVDKRIYVGYGSGAIGVLNAETGEKITEIKLPGHPESFQLEMHGNRLFVNVPAAHQVAVIDRRKAAVIATWPLKDAGSNFPMALDEDDHRLFIGCRTPARLIVLDTESGIVVDSLECAGDADDVFYDADNRRIYLSGGIGRVEVFEALDADHYKLVSQIQTALGARTSFFSRDMKTLFVAVPGLLLRQTQISAYSIP